MALQGVAWGKMMWDYSREAGSLAVGMEKTFNGQNPCSLCESVSEGKKKESGASVKAVSKTEGFLVASASPLPLPRAERRIYSERALAHSSRADSPPTPVPIVRA